MGNGALPHGPSYRAHPRLYSRAVVERTSVRGRKVPTSDICTAANLSLFDHLVGSGEQRARHLYADCPCGLLVYYELKFGWPHHGQIGRLFSLENTSDIDSSLICHFIVALWPVAHQTAHVYEHCSKIACRHCMSRRERDDLYPTVIE